VPTEEHQSPRRTTVPVAFRVSPELHARLREAAEATGRGMSEYLRDSMFTSTAVTAASVEKIQEEARWQERGAADIEIQALREELRNAVRLGAMWQQRAQTLERDLGVTSERLLFAVARALEPGSGARVEVARLWACLEQSEQGRMLPVVGAAIVERLREVEDEASPGQYAFERDVEVITNADWLIDLMTRAVIDPKSDAHAIGKMLVVKSFTARVAVSQRRLSFWSSLENRTTTELPPLSIVENAQPESGLPPSLISSAQEHATPRAGEYLSVLLCEESGWPAPRVHGNRQPAPG
jgi:hypothetical protein